MRVLDVRGWTLDTHSSVGFSFAPSAANCGGGKTGVGVEKYGGAV